MEQTTIDTILQTREEEYGGFVNVANTSYNLKKIVHNGITYDELTPVQKEAIDAILSKIARMVNGNTTYLDNMIDIEGYAKLMTNYMRNANKTHGDQSS